MSTKLSDKIVLYLYSFPLDYVSHDDLYLQIQSSWQGILDPIDFKHALKFLKGKKYIEEEIASYRITSDGEEHVLFLLNRPPGIAGKTFKAQLASNDIAWIGIAVAVVALIVAVLTGRPRGTDVTYQVTPSGTDVTYQATPSGPGVATYQVTPGGLDVVTPASLHDTGSVPFRIGDEVKVVLNGTVRVRRNPGYRNKPAGDTVCYASTGERFRIIGGPEYVDELWWWQVSNSRCSGWIAYCRRNGDVILGYP